MTGIDERVGRRTTLRFSSTCAACGTTYPAGTRAVRLGFDTVLCPSCAVSAAPARRPASP